MTPSADVARGLATLGVDGWARLADQAEVLMGQSPPSSSCSEDGDGLPFIQGNAEFGRRSPLPRLRCTSPARVAEAGDLLLSVRAPVGALNQATERTVIGRGLSALRFRAADQRFAWHAVSYAAPSLNRVAQGSTFVAVSRKDVECMVLPWHDEANPAIAAVLDTVDEMIEKTEAVIAKLRQVRTGLLHDLLACGLDENGQLRDPVAHPEQFQDSPLGLIPKAWKIASLVSQISFPEGQVDPRIDPYCSWTLLAPDHVESGTGTLLARVTALQQGAISGKYMCEPDDVIYSKIRPYLRKAVLATERGLCSADMYPLRPNEGIDSRFLLAVVLSEAFTRFASAVSMRSGFPKINRDEMAGFATGWPDSGEQNRIADMLAAADAETSECAKELAKLQQLKSGLMDDLLTGRVRVPEGVCCGG